MKWHKMLDNWKSGKVLTYPSHIKHPFLWRTSVLDKDEKLTYRQEFVIDKYLPMEQDYSSFQDYLKKSKNKYVTSFINLCGDTILIVPIPKRGKNFAHIKNFIDNASITQQKEVWKQVTIVARKLLKKHKYIWISTHGHGVPYLHIRIGIMPKYYQKSKLAKIPKISTSN